MTSFKPKPDLKYVAVRDLKPGMTFAHSQSPNQRKECYRVDDLDKRNQQRVWYRNAKNELRSMALFPGTKLIDMTGTKATYKFVGRITQGTPGGMERCYQFREELTNATVAIPIRKYWAAP